MTGQMRHTSTPADADLRAAFASFQSEARAAQAEVAITQREAQDRAFNEATIELPRERQEIKVKKILKKSKKKSLKNIKEGVEMARKPKMRTVQQYLCDQCDEIIPLPKDGSVEGFVIQGNIYTADPSKRGGLIGNNFPDLATGEKIDPEQVKQTVLCKECFIKALLPVGHNPYVLKRNHDLQHGVSESSYSARPQMRRWTSQARRDQESSRQEENYRSNEGMTAGALGGMGASPLGAYTRSGLGGTNEEMMAMASRSPSTNEGAITRASHSPGEYNGPGGSEQVERNRLRLSTDSTMMGEWRAEEENQDGYGGPEQTT